MKLAIKPEILKVLNAALLGQIFCHYSLYNKELKESIRLIQKLDELRGKHLVQGKYVGLYIVLQVLGQEFLKGYLWEIISSVRQHFRG